MPNPYGNPGNAGGGRKSAYQEKRDAQWHSDVWENLNDKAELEARIASGKFSGRDMALKKLLDGNTRIVEKFMDKLVPDLHELTGKDGAPLFLPLEIISKNLLHADNGTDTGSKPDSEGPAPV